MLKHFLPKVIRYPYEFFTQTRFLMALGFIVIGLLSRFVPHPPNFTALNAIALLGVSTLGSKRFSFLTLFSVMILPDLLIGLHSSALFVYLGFASIALLGLFLKKNASFTRSTLFLVLSSILFFAITNFGSWIVSPFYPKTAAGLAYCYLAGVPFLTNNLLGSLVYGGLLLGWMALSKKSIPRLIRKGYKRVVASKG